MQKSTVRTINFLKCGTYMTVMSWLLVLAIVSAVLASDTVKGLTPAVKTAGTVIGIAVNIVYAFCMWMMRSEERAYTKAAVFFLCAAVAGTVTALAASGSYVLAALAGAASYILLLLGRIFECKSHSAVMDEVDFTVSEIWMKLRYWQIIANAAAALGCLLAPLDTEITRLVVSAGDILCTVVNVIHLAFLFRSAKLCRDLYGTLGR